MHYSSDIPFIFHCTVDSFLLSAYYTLVFGRDPITLSENLITFIIYLKRLLILDKRLNTLKKWLEKDLKLSILSIEVASADASFRRYFRVEANLTTDHSQFIEMLPASAQKSLQLTMIAMDSPPEHEDNALFANCTNFLSQCALNVPNIYAKNLSEGFLLIKDLGINTYDKQLNNDSVEGLYSDASNAIITLQANALQQQNYNSIPLYDNQKLLIEMSLFEDWYINKHHQSTLNTHQQKDLSLIFDALINNAIEQPQVLVHRDYHCRNLLVTEINNPGIIDYQDMVIGPITYDIVSLFKDCYIEWPNEKVTQWALQFHQAALTKGLCSETSTSQWMQWFDWMGIQRHLKILGIFCRLYYRDGKNQYMEDLHLTYHYLINTCSQYPELDSLKTILEEYPVSTS